MISTFLLSITQFYNSNITLYHIVWRFYKNCWYKKGHLRWKLYTPCLLTFFQFRTQRVMSIHFSRVYSCYTYLIKMSIILTQNCYNRVIRKIDHNRHYLNFSVTVTKRLTDTIYLYSKSLQTIFLSLHCDLPNVSYSQLFLFD